MRLVSFRRPGQAPSVGVMRTDGGVVDLHQSDSSLPKTIRELIAGGPDLLARAEASTNRPDSVIVADPKLAAPIRDPQKIVCVGLNYRDHAIETKTPIPKEPVIFNKFPTAIVGPNETVRLPRESTQVDFEGELVVVVGKRGRRIPRTGDGLRLRLHDRPRRFGPRLAEEQGRQAVAARQELRLRSLRSGRRSSRRMKSPIRTRSRFRLGSTAKSCRTRTPAT